REQVLDAMTAFQVTWMLKGVVERGTAAQAFTGMAKPVAGKTGTTNDEKDAWFIGYTPDLTVGVYLGYDKPRHLARGATGGHLAAPIVKDFMTVALRNRRALLNPRRCLRGPRSLHAARIALSEPSGQPQKFDHACRTAIDRRCHQAVRRAAEEASLTSTNRKRALPSSTGRPKTPTCGRTRSAPRR